MICAHKLIKKLFISIEIFSSSLPLLPFLLYFESDKYASLTYGFFYDSIVENIYITGKERTTQSSSQQVYINSLCQVHFIVLPFNK